MIESVYKLVEAGKTDAALDLVFDVFDAHFTGGRFDDVDVILRAVDISRVNADVLVGLLSYTVCAKENLPSRKYLFDKINVYFADRGRPMILKGLE